MRKYNSEYSCEACGSDNIYIVVDEDTSDSLVMHNSYLVVCRECDHLGKTLVPVEGSWDEAHLQAPVPHEEDMVNEPPHYRKHPSGVECIDITEHMDFCLGNATKYIWRAGLKGGNEIEDLKKAIYYLNRKIKQIEVTHNEQRKEVII